MASPSIKLRQPPNTRIVQSFHLVWLDESIDENNNDDCRNSIMTLRQVVYHVNAFADVDKCIDFINDIKEETAFMIVSGGLSTTILPIVQDISQVSSVYILCEKKTQHEDWTKEWPKVKGVYTDIISICVALKQVAQEYDRNSVSISFVKTTDGASKENLDELDQSFMYTQILKEILLTIEFKQEHIDEFLTYCREQFVDSNTQLTNIDKIEREYHLHQPIWWYTYEYLLYSMLNRALRTMEVDLIIRMGFFVQYLHKQIAELHFEQYDGHHYSNSFTVYRGQGLSQAAFVQLKNTQGGLLSFNNFLSTSLDRAVSFCFAESNQYNPAQIGILFEIVIDPSISSVPFANIGNVSYYRGEQEILFSMHSIFRIGQVKQIDKNDRLWQVDLTLTGDNDPQLHALTERIREETVPTEKGWYRLCNLLFKLGQFGKAQQLSDIMLDQATNEGEKASSYHMLGLLKNQQGKYEEAITIYEKSLEIFRKTLPVNYLNLAASYSSIGNVYDNMGEYSKALSSHEKALEIERQILPTNHPHLASSYNSISLVYRKIGNYSKALSYCEKVLEILQKSLPANHPDLAGSYNNIGSIYYGMGDYSKALFYYEKVFKIQQKTLPARHPDLALSYNNIGSMYGGMGDYSKALSYCEKALAIQQKILPAHHHNLAISYNNIESVYYEMSEYSKALLYYGKAREIEQKALPANHPDWFFSYNNIGNV